MTKDEIMKAAKQLSHIYNSVGNVRVDPNEKTRLYSLASRFPEIHHMARRICNGESI
jgi:hypothetical protein